MKIADATTLFKYFRQCGISANPQARADIMGKIADDELKAYTTVTSAPSGSSWQAMARDALLRDAYGPKIVPATSVAVVRSEIEKAAIGADADWGLLNRLLIDVPVENATKQIESQQSDRHVYKKEKHLGLILDALRAGGFEPKALPAREDGKATPKAAVRKILVGKKSLSASQFKRGWEYGKEIQEVAFVAI
ncbi:hypothetical protein [Luteimonas arsenica]|uniref:hypothetical protein n=1 Tax=Luteimonas arsenica TaxID=1586242 RepID=UPI0010568827|nr:hypothetical protein [Luteimonas arsenica]